MIASSFFDPMLGVDVHWEMVPMPAPVPTPIPNPFVGIVRDFTGLAAGLAISNAIGAVMGGTPKGPVLYWGAIPATNTGTNGVHVTGHILIPPGTAWAPVPKTPVLKVRPTDKPKIPKPVSPDNDAVIVFGSKTVTVLGSNAVRFGDIALSCSEPLRLPSTVVMAVPKGRPILIGGPMSLDLAAAILASLRTRFIGDSLQAGISHLPIGSRGRAVLSWVACTLTGHPVDVATGKMMTRVIDAELPGPLPLRIERFYQSNFAARPGPLGHGWSFSLDQAIWEERGKVVLLTDDGREIEFDTFTFPDHRMRAGDVLWYPIDRLTLKCEGQGNWSVTSSDGIRRDFAPVRGRSDRRSCIQRMVSRCQHHDIVFNYDLQGRLDSVRDCAGRLIRIEQDEHGRVTVLKLPQAREAGWYVHRRYEYDGEGDLVRVVDSKGNTWTFEYVTHLMVRETDRTAASFYFEYDSLGEDAWCTRTWGDGGIYDHVLKYDKKERVTYVTNSLGHTTQYYMGVGGLVVKTIDARGGVHVTEWNANFQKTASIDPLGRKWEFHYDNEGNISKQLNPDGSGFELAWNRQGRLTKLLHSTGVVSRWEYDLHGRVVKSTDPAGVTTRFHYEGAYLVASGNDAHVTARFYYNSQHALIRAVDSAGHGGTWHYDNLGRMITSHDDNHREIRRTFDTEGQLLATDASDGEVTRMEYDAEGHVTHLISPGVEGRFEYAFRDRVSRMSVGGSDMLQSFDREGRPLQTRAANGAVLQYEYDGVGEVRAITDLDGSRRVYARDKCGQIIAIKKDGVPIQTVSYNQAGKVTRIVEADGYFTEYTYDEHGLIAEAKTASSTIRYERDSAARVIREWQDEQWISYQYDQHGGRKSVETSFGIKLLYGHDEVRGMYEIVYRDRNARTWNCSFQRSPDGLTERWSLPHALDIQWNRDSHGRLTKHQAFQRNKIVESETLYWNAGQELARVTGPQQTIEVAAQGFDTFLRSVGPEGRTDSRFVDQNGNAWKSSEERERSFGPGGRLLHGEGLRCNYDDDGNLINKKDAQGREWNYRWGLFGRLEEVIGPEGDAVRFTYDAFDRRMSKQVGGREVRWLWDGDTIIHEWEVTAPGSHQVETVHLLKPTLPRPLSPRIDFDGRIASLVTWVFRPGTFIPLVRDNGWGAPRSLVTNISGAPVGAYNQSERRWCAEVNLWGKSTETEVSDPESRCPFRFPGQYEDVETGLYYNRYRYYDPALGIYLSPDPDSILRPISRYGYVANPLTMSDPLGLAQTAQAWIVNPDGSTRVVGIPEGATYSPSGGHFEEKIIRAVEEDAGHMAALSQPGSKLVILGQGGADFFHAGGGRIGVPRVTRPPKPNCPGCQSCLQEFANQFEGREGQVIVEHVKEGRKRNKLYRCGG